MRHSFWQAPVAFVVLFAAKMLQLTWSLADLQAVNKVQGKTEEKKQEGQGCTIM